MLDCQIVLIVGLKRPLSALGWCRQIGHDLSKLLNFYSILCVEWRVITEIQEYFLYVFQL